MKKNRKFRWWPSLFLLGIAMSGCHSNDLKLKIISAKTAQSHQFKVEVADDPGERIQGLMYRKELGADEGMFFIFPNLNENPFWMKNTLIPLDILFIGEDKKISTIVANAEPQTTTPRRPLQPYLYVLEILGGRAQQLDIKVGDRIEY